MRKCNKMQSNQKIYRVPTKRGESWQSLPIEKEAWRILNGDEFHEYEELESKLKKNEVTDIEEEPNIQMVIIKPVVSKNLLILVFGALAIIAVGDLILAFALKAWAFLSVGFVVLAIGYTYRQRAKLPMFSDWSDNGRTMWHRWSTFSFNYGPSKSKEKEEQGGTTNNYYNTNNYYQ